MFTARHIPDAAFPCGQYDIPVLRADLQPIGLNLPFVIWGSTGRRAAMHGTWGFYTDDYRFTGLWTAPQRLLNTQPTCIVEPNLSVHNNLPEALVIANTYKKRWLARLYQELAGITVWVDLNVSERYREINMIGVPAGWRAFCTRGYASALGDLEDEYTIAANCAYPAPPIFMVYGGGRKVKELCQERGWLWVTEQQDIAQKRPISEIPYLNLDLPKAIARFAAHPDPLLLLGAGTPEAV